VRLLTAGEQTFGGAIGRVRNPPGGRRSTTFDANFFAGWETWDQQRAIEAQLSGFLWNRKLEYGALIVNTLDLDRIPRPLAGVLAHVLPDRM
jgi:hypothetical protein